MLSNGPKYQANTTRLPGRLTETLSTAVSSGPLLSVVREIPRVCQPLLRGWWMKQLLLLAVLQSACLALGLMMHSDRLAEGASGTAPFLLTFPWISFLQVGLGYVIFSRIYREYLIRVQGFEQEIGRQQSALSRTRDAVVLGLTRMAASRDDGTEGHLERVGTLAEIISDAAGSRPEFRTVITPHFVRLIRFSATLHDIGKVGIEDAILQKPGSLTDDERKRMQRHTRISSSCLKEVEACLGDSDFLQMAHEIALFHHERWDGSGYPTGLSGEQIPLAARIVSIVDVYDALAAKRPYKEAYEHDRCVSIITAGRGSQFDPRLIDIFLEIQDQFRAVVAAGKSGPDKAETNEQPSRESLSMPTCELERILAEVNTSLQSVRTEHESVKN